MQKYIDQLVEDLEEVAENPPAPAFIEPPPHLSDNPVTAELALVPFKTIEELTGIKQEVFPCMTDLQGKQWAQVSNAIVKVFESLNILLVDVPADFPSEQLYEVLTTNWHHPVQYLPSSGMDLELCTGDPMTCPYGEQCDCGEAFDEYEIPSRFLNIVPKIAESIDAGFVCFLNADTLEIEELPQMLLEDPDEYEMTTGFRLDDAELKHEGWDAYYTFEPLDSHEAFEIMESFTESLDDDKLRNKLFIVLNRRKPFANFKWEIDNSPYRQAWFDFKQKWLEKHVKCIICKYQ